TQRGPMTRMRNPFRKMASGMTKATTANRRHGVFRNKLAAKMLVINSTQLDRIPLHSCATSMVRFGSWKNRTRPQKRRAADVEKRLATSAEADFEAVSSASAIAS